MSLGGEKSFKMRMRDMENAFKYRRIPYPKRWVYILNALKWPNQASLSNLRTTETSVTGNMINIYYI